MKKGGGGFGFSIFDWGLGNPLFQLFTFPLSLVATADSVAETDAEVMSDFCLLPSAF
jgi:hypothetical protein